MTFNPKTSFAIAAIFVSSTASMACQRTPTEAHQEGVEAQREADEKAGKAQDEAREKIAKAREDEVEATKQARQNAAEAQATANEKIRDANRATTRGEGNETRTWAQAKLDDVDNMIDQASSKAQTATPKAKARFDSQLAEVRHQRDTLRTEVATLESSSGDRLEKAKEQFDDHVDRVKANIRNLDKSL